MRILIVSEAYPPTSGGVATSTQRIARNFLKLGSKVVVLTFDHSRPLDSVDYFLSENDEGVEVFRIGPFFLKQPSVEVGHISEKLRAIFRRRAFDQMEAISHEFCPNIILSFYVVNAGLLATYLARSIGCPHVVGVRGNDVGRNIFSTDRFAAVQFVVKSGDRIICVNNHLYKRLLLASPEVAPKTHIIMNSVELPFQTPTNRRMNYLHSNTQWSESDFIVTFIGTPREKKGISILLDAVDDASTKIAIKLLIVGPELSGVDRLQCGAKWNYLLERGIIHVTGQLNRKDALMIAAEADSVVMPSIEDGLPNGLLEGMALGLCPIVSDIFKDVVSDGINGWVVTRNVVDDLSRALIDAGTNEEERQKRAEKSRYTLSTYYCPLREINEYLGVFDGLLK